MRTSILNTATTEQMGCIIFFFFRLHEIYRSVFILLVLILLFLPYMDGEVLEFLQSHPHLSYSQGKQSTYEVVLLLYYLMCEQNIYLFHLLHGSSVVLPEHLLS